MLSSHLCLRPVLMDLFTIMFVIVRRTSSLCSPTVKNHVLIYGTYEHSESTKSTAWLQLGSHVIITFVSKTCFDGLIYNNVCNCAPY